MIETWGFYLFCTGPGQMLEPEAVTPEDYQRAYDQYLDLWQRCEGWGFDGLAFAEHHFNPINLSPSPHLLVAAVAQRTERLRFTALGEVLALHDGRRVAEECGMLAYLTNGRFEPGIAPGAGPDECVAAGIPADQIRPRYYSAAEVLGKALAGPRVTHHDDFHNLDEVGIVPRMQLSPGQSVWVTVMSPDSVVWTAQRGYKMCTSWMPIASTQALAGAYYEAAEAAGRPATPLMLGLRRRTYVAETDAAAQEACEAAEDVIEKQIGKAFETIDPAILAIFKDPDDFIVGSPDTVAEKWIEQCRAGGYGVAMALTDFKVFQPEDLARSHELLGTKVAPILRSADLNPTTAAAGSLATADH